METISSFLTHDHRECDEEFANLENVVASGDWTQSKVVFDKFASDMQHHFDMEEKVMFPQFEEKSGMSCGPTQVMRMEHQQMTQVIADMRAAVESSDKDRFFGLSETLMMLIQQHNMKEEQMLYRMADNHFAADVENVVNQMKELERA